MDIGWLELILYQTTILTLFQYYDICMCSIHDVYACVWAIHMLVNLWKSEMCGIILTFYLEWVPGIELKIPSWLGKPLYIFF